MSEINVFDATTGQVVVRPYDADEATFAAEVAAIPLAQLGITPVPSSN